MSAEVAGAAASTASSGHDAVGQPVVLPYCEIVGKDQASLRLALEIAFVCPTVGGVLAYGHRGTAKSTTVRSFAQMTTGRLPTTLPIGATDDRVLGGWRVEDLMASKPEWQQGLIEEAGTGEEPGMLYIDEVNLLDDHLTNIILDVASTGILVVQREGAAKEPIKVRFSLVGTMNPEEGNLRPQLLDRFGLVVVMKSACSAEDRARVLQTVLKFEESDSDPESEFLKSGYERDEARYVTLLSAQGLLPQVDGVDALIGPAAKIADGFEVEGHRGELAMLRAARALAAIEAAETSAGTPKAGMPKVEARHLHQVAPLALVHRRAASDSGTVLDWSAEDDQRLAELITTAYS